METEPVIAQRVLTDVRDSVLTVTISRPERLNAVDRATAADLRDALVAAREDDTIRAVVLTGTGRGFCTGADLAAGSDQPRMTRTVKKTPLNEWNQVTKAIDEMDKPVIAAVNGMAVGAGLSFATACDRRIAAASARFAAIFVRRGLVPDAGMTYFLPRLVGIPAATDLVMTGALIDAQRALQIGLVDEVCPDDELTDRVQSYAAGLAAGASVAIDLARRAVRRSLERDLDAAISYEAWAQSAVGSTADVKEGIQAFLQKREPRFRGE
ncbi:MAG: enoyl-CoA hydratase/isomerase family protein [Chloroflexi bacterium]|nr:enoyl-CoA hydratase/isomerase family protein [Chloroflexota bacterium]